MTTWITGPDYTGPYAPCTWLQSVYGRLHQASARISPDSRLTTWAKARQEAHTPRDHRTHVRRRDGQIA